MAGDLRRRVTSEDELGRCSDSIDGVFCRHSTDADSPNPRLGAVLGDGELTSFRAFDCPYLLIVSATLGNATVLMTAAS